MSLFPVLVSCIIASSAAAADVKTAAGPDARTYQNRLLWSESLSTSPWAVTTGGGGSTPRITDNYAAAPDGVSSVTRLQLDKGPGESSGDFAMVLQPLSVPNPYSGYFIFAYKSAGSSDQQFGAEVTGGDVHTFTATAAWQIAVLTGNVTQGVTQARFLLRGGVMPRGIRTADILVCNVQLSDLMLPYVKTASAPAPAFTGDSDGGHLTAPNTIVLLGDSLSNNPPGSASGFWVWANGYMGQKFTLLHNGGVGGETTGQMLARIQKDVLDYHPAWCWVQGGSNDISIDADEAEIWKNLTTIYGLLRQNGINVIAATIPASSQIVTTPSRIDTWARTNDRIRQFVAQNPGMVGMDVSEVFTDPLSPKPQPIAELTRDGTHYNANGAITVGRAIAEKLSFLPSSVSALSYNYDPSNLIVNGLMMGEGGAVPGLAAGWTNSEPVAGAAAAFKKESRPDGFGDWQRVDISGVNPDDDFMVYQDILGTFVQGDRYYMQFEIEHLAPPQSAEIWGELTAYGQLTTTNKCPDYWNADVTQPITMNPGRLLFKVDPIVIPSSTDRLRAAIHCKFGGKMSFRFGRVEVRKVMQ